MRNTWVVLIHCAEEVVVLALMFPLTRGTWEQLVLPSDFLFLKGTDYAALVPLKAYSWLLGSLGKVPLGLAWERKQSSLFFLSYYRKDVQGFSELKYCYLFFLLHLLYISKAVLAKKSAYYFISRWKPRFSFTYLGISLFLFISSICLNLAPKALVEILYFSLLPF